jgi:Phosphotransferase enzyme family
MLKIPSRPCDLSTAYVNELVGELRPGVGVASADIVGIRSYGDADKAASVSTSAQVKLDVRYVGRTCTHLPEKILAKVSFPDDMECSNPILDAEFENEVLFYNRLRPELDIETPLGLGGRFDSESKRFVLLMEDLTPRAPHINSMMDNDDLSIVRAVLDTLAKLHAHYWETPRFKADLSWVQNQVEGSLETLFEGFLRAHVVKELNRERFKREFAEEVGMTEATLFAGTRALKRHQATLPQTMLHGDAHFGNTYVLPDGTGGVLDWQVSARGFLMHDVGYLIQTALSVAARRKNERELLEFYRDRLCFYGVASAPDLPTLWLEFRRSMIYGFHMGWLTAPRENYGWETMVLGNHRTKAAFLDHDTGGLIAELL